MKTVLACCIPSILQIKQLEPKKDQTFPQGHKTVKLELRTQVQPSKCIPSVPSCAVYNFKGPALEWSELGLQGQTGVGLDICSCTFWPHDLRWAPKVLWAADSWSITLGVRMPILKGCWITWVIYIHPPCIIDTQKWWGFLLHFPSDIKGSHEASVGTLTSLMGSCSWLQWMRAIKCRFIIVVLCWK